MMLNLSLPDEDWIVIKNILIKHQRTAKSHPLIEQVIEAISLQTDLFEMVYKFLKNNDLNPIFLPVRSDIESFKGGYSIIKKMSMYKGSEKNGINAFRKDYNAWINDLHYITLRGSV